MLNALHGVVKIAGDLHGQSAMIEGLGELAIGNLAAADKNDSTHEPRGRAEDRQRGAGVAGAGAGSTASAGQTRMRKRRGHAVVFEAARRVHPLVLQEQLALIDADVTGHAVGALEDGLPFADGHDLVRRGEGQQLAEAPDAGEAERIGAVGPLGLEVAQRARRRQAVPVVGDVQEAAAARADELGLVHGAGRAAVGADTALEDGVHGAVNSPWC